MSLRLASGTMSRHWSEFKISKANCGRSWPVLCPLPHPTKTRTDLCLQLFPSPLSIGNQKLITLSSWKMILSWITFHFGDHRPLFSISLRTIFRLRGLKGLDMLSTPWLSSSKRETTSSAAFKSFLSSEGLFQGNSLTPWLEIPMLTRCSWFRKCVKTKRFLMPEKLTSWSKQSTLNVLLTSSDLSMRSPQDRDSSMLKRNKSTNTGPQLVASKHSRN